MDILKTSIISVLFLAGALFVSVTHYGWPLAIVLIMFYISNILDRRIAIITTLLNVIRVNVFDQDNEETEHE